MLRTKNVYEPPAPEDGLRLLVMRKWPRGVRKDAIDAWEKELGPSLALLSDWREGKIDWEQFKNRYEAEMNGQSAIIGSLVQKAQSQTVTLLCGCRDEERCHRTLLKGYVENTGGGETA